MSAFDRLHPAIQYHVVNSLGWNDLRPLQAAAIDPVLAGHHAILLAPTAGGKTEAAIFPVFSRMLSENWSALSVLYICPIKALLNNLEPRLESFAALLGRRTGVWHGDITPSVKSRILADPPDLLLTTPESLEVMLVSQRVDHRRFFGRLKVVIVDEIHAFAGDDRGWHLLYVLERLNHLAEQPLQRLGLSATVGNPQGLCAWLSAGGSKPGEVVIPEVEATTPPEVEVDFVGSLWNAAVVISRLHQGEKRLVFCDSRSRVEELSSLLRNLGVNTFVSHSSLSREERKDAEDAFSEGDDCVIVATSTLELGLDVGDLDRVVQIDAPSTVSSFLQRIGRSGRRAGMPRNCLFLNTTPDALLKCLALLRMWTDGYVEPINPPASPFHLFAQQIMALALQERGIGRRSWRDWFDRLPGLEDSDPLLLESVINHMINLGILFEDQGILGIGRAGEREYGKRNFMNLFSVFVSPPLIRVLYGKQELGVVHQSTFLLKHDGPATLSLAGRAWETRHVDWGKRVAYVQPSTGTGRSQWLGTDQPLPFELCRSMAAVLEGKVPPIKLTQRAQDALTSLREEFPWVTVDRTYLVTDESGKVRWWTFAGRLLNLAIGSALERTCGRVTVDNLSIGFPNVESDKVALEETQKLVRNPEIDSTIGVDAATLAELKFQDCVPPEAVAGMLSSRFSVQPYWSGIAQLPISVIHVF